MLCVHCRHEFFPSRPEARFCSVRCRVAAHRQRATPERPGAPMAPDDTEAELTHFIPGYHQAEGQCDEALAMIGEGWKEKYKALEEVLFRVADYYDPGLLDDCLLEAEDYKTPWFFHFIKSLDEETEPNKIKGTAKAEEAAVGQGPGL